MHPATLGTSFGIWLFAIAASSVASDPAAAQDYQQARANALAQACSDERGSDGSFSVGACLALARENSTNELSTLCAWAKQQGLLAENSFENVGECIAYLNGIEEEVE